MAPRRLFTRSYSLQQPERNRHSAKRCTRQKYHEFEPKFVEFAALPACCKMCSAWIPSGSRQRNGVRPLENARPRETCCVARWSAGAKNWAARTSAVGPGRAARHVTSTLRRGYPWQVASPQRLRPFRLVGASCHSPRFASIHCRRTAGPAGRCLLLAIVASPRGDLFPTCA